MTDQLPAIVNLAAYHGDSWAQTFRLKYGATPVDLAGATVAAWAITRAGGVVELAAAVTNAAGGEVQISVGPGGLPKGTYTYDVEVTGSAGGVTTWVRGTLTVPADVTNPEPVGAR
jgi:hypothetical protein